MIPFSDSEQALDECRRLVVGARIRRFLQTPAKRMKLEGVSEPFYHCLHVLLLDDGRYVQVGEYCFHDLEVDPAALIPAQLVQEEFSLADVEGRTIRDIEDFAGEFAVVLDSGLCLSCPCNFGGNMPWLYRNEPDGS